MARPHSHAEQSAGVGNSAGERSRNGRLTRERVLAGALELVDREGLSTLSMRRLGAELGVEAMALYRYAAGKDALLDGLVEAVYLEVEERLDLVVGTATTPGEVPWRTGLHRIARANYEVLLAHPQVVPLLFTRMMEVPLARRPLAVLKDHERVLALLRQAGFDEVGAAAVFRAFTAWVLGYISMELCAMVDNPDEPDPSFRLGLHRMPPQDLARLREAAPALSHPGGPQGLASGLNGLLDRYTRTEGQR
nr:TetR/AcrR family transcriptional regulator [Streptomyces cavernae]